MNGNASDDATDPPVSLNNEATPDSAIFSGTAPASTATAGAAVTAFAASTILSDAHIPP